MYIIITYLGYADKGEVWREGYDLEGYDFRADIERLYIELKPFYKEVDPYFVYPWPVLDVLAAKVSSPRPQFL